MPAAHATPPAQAAETARTPNFGLVYHFLAQVVDPTPSEAAPVQDVLLSLNVLERRMAVALMNTMARNLASKTFWDLQMQLITQGKPSVVTSTSGNFGNRWGLLGFGGPDVGGGLLRAGASGSGPGYAHLPLGVPHQHMPVSLPSVYSMPMLAGPRAAAPPPPLPGAGIIGESPAVAAEAPWEPVQPPPAAPAAPAAPWSALLPELQSARTLVAVPPAAKPEPPPPQEGGT